MIQSIAIIVIIINILVYIKVPEFLQTIIIKRLDKRIAETQIENENKLNQMQLDFKREYQKLEQDFTINLEIYKKRYSVLLELYKLLAEFEASVNQVQGDVIKRFALAKNYRALNQFYISKEIYKISGDSITAILDLYTDTTKLRNCDPNLIDELTKKVAKQKEIKEGHLIMLEEKIHEIIPK